MITTIVGVNMTKMCIIKPSTALSTQFVFGQTNINTQKSAVAITTCIIAIITERNTMLAGAIPEKI